MQVNEMGTGGEPPYIELDSCSESSKVEEFKHTDLPELRIQKLKIKVPRMRLRTSTLEAKRLLKKMSEQTAIVVALWPQQIETTRKLEREVKLLQQKLLEGEMEIMDMKRRRWCRACEKEATYLDKSKKFFYCSERCEKQHHRELQLRGHLQEKPPSK